MLSKWPIRNKLLIGIGLLLVIVATLSGSGFLGVYAYRSLVKSLSGRANELPRAAELSEQVSDLRVITGEIRSARGSRADGDLDPQLDRDTLAQKFADHLQ